MIFFLFLCANVVVKMCFYKQKQRIFHTNDFYTNFNKYRHYCKIMLTRHDSTQVECSQAIYIPIQVNWMTKTAYPQEIHRCVNCFVNLQTLWRIRPHGVVWDGE